MKADSHSFKQFITDFHLSQKESIETDLEIMA